MCGRGITNFENVSELSIRVSPSHSYNAVMAGLGWGGWVALMGMCMLHAGVVLCFWYRYQTKISRGGLKGAARRFDNRTV